MKNLYLIFLLSMMLFGCSKHEKNYNRLVEIDSLLLKEMVDSAIFKIKSINPQQLDKQELGYYHLLKTQTQYKAYIPITSDSVINLAIECYKRTNEKEKLARSYYLKAGILYDLKKEKNAMEYLKTAEDLLKGTDENVLLHNIYFMISTINYDYHECRLSLEYAQKAFQCSKHTRKELHLIYDYERMANAYSCIGQKDSCLYYMKKNLSIIEKVNLPQKHKAGMISNYGMDFIEYDKEQAEEILQRAVSIYPLGSTYSALARIQLERKDTLKAIELFQKSINNSEDYRIKQANLIRLSKIEQETGNYKLAHDLLQKAQNLKDSFALKFREDNVKALQLEYDKNAENAHTSHLLAYAIFGIVVILFLGTVVATIFAKQSAAAKQMVKTEEARATGAEERAIQIEKQSNRKLKGINRILDSMKQKEKESKKDERQRGRMLEHGHALYTELLAGGNIGRWKRQDFTDFIGYYRMTNGDYAESTDQHYIALTPSQSVLTILEHWGKNDKEIMQVMCLSEGALRTQRSRMKQRLYTN